MAPGVGPLAQGMDLRAAQCQDSAKVVLFLFISVHLPSLFCFPATCTTSCIHPSPPTTPSFSASPSPAPPFPPLSSGSPTLSLCIFKTPLTRGRARAKLISCLCWHQTATKAGMYGAKGAAFWLRQALSGGIGARLALSCCLAPGGN